MLDQTAKAILFVTVAALTVVAMSWPLLVAIAALVYIFS